jgi:hypothetical protein
MRPIVIGRRREASAGIDEDQMGSKIARPLCFSGSAIADLSVCLSTGGVQYDRLSRRRAVDRDLKFRVAGGNGHRLPEKHLLGTDLRKSKNLSADMEPECD